MADNGKEGISDTVPATPVAAVLATALAAAGSPSVVHNAAVRGAETWTLVTLAVLTVIVGKFIQEEFGDDSLSSSEFIVLVLAPAITRVDLVLLMWTNLNRALIWGEVLFSKDARETPTVMVLQAAATIWNDGDDDIANIDELGGHGGNATVLLRGLALRYAPWTAGTNPVAWILQTTMYPAVAALYAMMHVLCVVGFFMMAATSSLAIGSRRLFNLLTGHSQSRDDIQVRRILRTSEPVGLRVVWRLLTGHTAEALLMTSEQGDIFDKAYYKIPGIGMKERALWAMLAAVDVHSRLFEYKKLFARGYPMRLAGRVHARVTKGGNGGEMTRVLQVLKTRWTMFDQLPDDTNARNGQPASRQTVYYRVIGWPQAQQSMQSRAYTIRDTARKWSTTFKELQSSALPGEPDDIASMINRVHDVLRGWTVQATMLMWWDGLAEAENHIMERERQARRKSVTAQAVSTMVAEMAGTQQPGVELGVRLLHRAFNAHDMTAQMTDGPIKSGLVRAADALQNWPEACGCEICGQMEAEGKLEGERTRGGSSVSALAPTLSHLRCECGPSIVSVWMRYAEGYINAVYAH